MQGILPFSDSLLPLSVLNLPLSTTSREIIWFFDWAPFALLNLKPVSAPHPNSALTALSSLAVELNSIVHGCINLHLLYLLLPLNLFKTPNRPGQAIETVKQSDGTATPCDLFVLMLQLIKPQPSWVAVPSLWIDRQVPDIFPLAQFNSSTHFQSSCLAFRRQ